MARILLIEDSPTEAAVITQMLERNGHEVSHAPDAEQGMAACREQLPQLVVMDVVLPGINGFQATRALAKDPLTQDIPVIILTTKSMETDRMWGMRQGAKDFMVKPPEEKAFMARIAELVGA